MRHVIFYDGECGFCDQIVQFVMNRDKNELFAFAPLQGKTAKEKLAHLLKNIDTVILIENYNLPTQKIYVLGEAAFRILWLLGGKWTFLGWISFLPPFLYNWGYRLVAKNRHLFFSNKPCIPTINRRFLP